MSEIIATAETQSHVPNVTVVHHPLISHLLSILRNRNTGTASFYDATVKISELLAYEATRDFMTCTYTVETPVDTALVEALSGWDPVVVPILRAGLAMHEGFRKLYPDVTVGHIGLARDETTLQPHPYYEKLPRDLSPCEVIVLDPMVATGGSASDAIDRLKNFGYRHIRLLCIISVAEGLWAIHERHPDVPIYTCAVDKCLNEKGYIVPGLGDAGDRLFGTL